MKTKPKPSQVLRGVAPVATTPPATTLPAYPVPDERPGWRTMLVVALGLVLLYFVTARPIAESDPAARSAYALTSALATDRSASIDHFVRSSSGFFLSNPNDFPNGAYYQGHYYSDSAPGASLLALPFYQFGRMVGDLFATIAPASDAPAEAPAALSLLAIALAGAGTALLVYAVARRLGSAILSARYAALTVGLASALWREAGRFGPPVVSLLLLTAALYLAFPRLPRYRNAGQTAVEKFVFSQALFIGLILGFAVTVDYSNLVWTPLFVGYLLWAKRLRPATCVGLAGGWLLGLLPLLLYNWAIFGVPWAFTYGYLLDNPEARSLTGQFFGGFTLDNLRQTFFGEGRGLLGPFLALFGIWGLVALFGQRGKRKEAVLLMGLILVNFVFGLLRRPVGEGSLRVDFIAGVLPPLVLGVAVWHERFLFLTRLEQRWLPQLALWGVAVYYFIAWPGPLWNNFGALVYLLPFLVIFALVGLVWWATRGVSPGRKGLALTAGIVLFALLGLFLNQPRALGYAYPGEANNLLYNSSLDCQGQKLPGWYLSEECTLDVGGGIALGANAQLQPYLIPVQGGKSYVLELHAEEGENLTATWSWSDEGHNPLPGQFSQTWKKPSQGGNANWLVALWNDQFAQTWKKPSQILVDKRAAPPAAAYLQLTFKNGPSWIALRSASLWDDSPRLEPMRNYATAALSFSFDWESAMGGLIHSKGGASFAQGEGEAGGIAASETNRQRAVANAEERGMLMRQGADNLLSFFQQFNIRGTFYATGYNLIDGNPDRIQFNGNPIYKWASTKNLWDNDYWTTHPWYGDDPYGTYQTNPAWYFGDQTDRLLKAGQDIQSHTFGHLYVRGTSPAEFQQDLETWLNYANARGIEARSFAFPWTSSNSVKGEHYQILADLGFSSVTRLYPADQAIRVGGDGGLSFDNGKRTSDNKVSYEAEAGPQNFYYYLSRIKYEPRLLSLNDYQLISTDKSEAQAKALIDQLLIRRGYGSIWTHPEAVVDPRDKGFWQRVIAYAASKRDSGLWVDSVTNIIQQRLDIQKVGVETTYSTENGQTRLRITLTNRNPHPVEGLTVTLPGKINRMQFADGKPYQDFKGTQFVIPKLEAGQSITLVAYLNG